MKDLNKGLNSLQKSKVDIGYFNGEIHNGSKMSLASLMTILEYGSDDGNIPARFPFSQIAFSDSPKRNKNIKNIIKNGVTVALKKGNSNQVLDGLGKAYMSSIRSIFGDTSRLVSNAKLTIKLKGRDEPLIEEGELLSKLSYRKIN